MLILLFGSFLYNFLKNYRQKSSMKKYGIKVMANISNVKIEEYNGREIFTKSSAFIKFKDQENVEREITQISRGSFLYRYTQKRKIDNFDTEIIYLANSNTAYVLINKLDINFYLYNCLLFFICFLLISFLFIVNFIS